MIRWVLIVLALAVPSHALANRYVVENGSKVAFIANHPTHVVRGESIRVSGEIFWDPAKPENMQGVVGRAIQASWLSFDSGNANRDSNMRAAVNAGKYPNLTFVPMQITETVLSGQQLKGKLHGRLYINGVRREVEAPLTLDLSDPRRLRVQAGFGIKMTDYKIDPPSLLFVKTDNDVAIEVDLVFEPTESVK